MRQRNLMADLNRENAFQYISKLLRHRKISLETKKLVLKFYVISVFVYRGEMLEHLITDRVET